MEVDTYSHTSLFAGSDVDQDLLLREAIAIRNTIIGNRRQKGSYIHSGIVPKLLFFVDRESAAAPLKTEVITILGSLAKGSTENSSCLIREGSIPVLLKVLRQESSSTVVEACVRCLRTLACQWGDESAWTNLYGEPWVVPRLLELMSPAVASLSAPSASAECALDILSSGCRNEHQQNYLFGRGIAPYLVAWLCHPSVRHQQRALDCLVKLCYQNRKIASELLLISSGGIGLPQMMTRQLCRDRPASLRIAAAKWFTYMYRADAVKADDPILKLKVLPTLVAMCKPDRPVQERTDGAEMLAYLVEMDQGLQASASMTERCISVLSMYFSSAASPDGAQYTSAEKDQLHQAALRAFAALGANDGDNRKKIMDIGGLMEHITTGLSMRSSASLRLAAARCLHSLSRSVQQLRTVFQDHAVWKPLMAVLRNASDDLLSTASSALCNLLLDFSPSKEPIIDLGAIDLLVDLTKSDSVALRLNGIWALMNMAFQADQKVKDQILTALGTDRLFRLLSDSNINVLMKTLGLLRNLLSPKAHIDQIMAVHGMQIMQAVTLILEGEHIAEIKEQTLCILSNIAHGDDSKEFIMGNDDILKKILNYMQHSCVQLQIAATMCVSNLVWCEEAGARERQRKLQALGALRLLNMLLQSDVADPTLLDQLKTALHQFNS